MGCVYFFRHIGLTPVKIGFTDENSPINRFNQFRTYAPYGSELLGFIITTAPAKIESELHKRFSGKRLKGEWFDIGDEIVSNMINDYSSSEDKRHKNEFEISWAKHIKLTHDKDKIERSDKEMADHTVNFYIKKEFEKLYRKDNKLNRTHTAKNLGVSKVTILRWIRDIDERNLVYQPKSNFML